MRGEEEKRRGGGARAEEIGEYSGGGFSATLSLSPFSLPEYVLQIGTGKEGKGEEIALGAWTCGTLLIENRRLRLKAWVGNCSTCSYISYSNPKSPIFHSFIDVKLPKEPE
jgi:hypothetical protein